MQTQAKILLTGASGMIGSALARLLKEQGFSQVFTPTHAELELRDQQAVFAYFQQHKPEYVFHLAARVGGIHANSAYPGQFLYDNTSMQINIIEACRRYGVEKLLFPGSACTYPKFAPQPVKESEFLNGMIEPTNLAYATAKINGLVMAQSYAKEYGLNIVLPMPTNTYGIGDNFDPSASHVIPALMKRFHEAKRDNLAEVVMWGTGSPLREFIYVDDVADAMLFLMQRHEGAGLINLGSMQEISIRELAAIISEVVEYKGKISMDATKPDGAPRKMLDSTPLFALGWTSKIPLKDGLMRMYRHHFSS